MNVGILSPSIENNALPLDDHQSIDQSSPEQRRALQAITNTLQAVYSSSAHYPQVASKKRKFVKRSNGQLMTEQNVVQQLEEQRQRKATKEVPKKAPRKASKKADRSAKSNKRRKNDENGTYSISSALTRKINQASFISGHILLTVRLFVRYLFLKSKSITIYSWEESEKFEPRDLDL